MINSKLASKKRMMPAEMANRFSSKADFLRYFREQKVSELYSSFSIVKQYLVPPPAMVNKDYLKAILGGDKELLPLSGCKMVNVPCYDELSVKQIWPSCLGMPEIMRYFPNSLPKNRLPDR